MTTKKLTKPVCLFPKCDRPARVRGLCMRCYVAANRLVKGGRLKWSTLEARGVSTTTYRVGVDKILLGKQETTGMDLR